MTRPGPTDPAAQAAALLKAGKAEDAVAVLRRTVQRTATPPMLLMLALAHIQAGQFEQAAFTIDRVLAGASQGPHTLEAYLLLGRLEVARDRPEKAIEAYQRVLSLDPRNRTAPVALSELHLKRDDLASAHAALSHAVGSLPELADAWNMLANMELVTGQAEQSIATLRRGIARIPGNPELDTSLCASLNYQPGVPASEVFEAHRTFGQKTMSHIRTAPPTWPAETDPERRLRIGWLSPDFRRSSVAYFAEPLLANLDRGAFEHTLFSTGAKRDQFTDRFAGYGDLVPCRDVDAKALPELIRTRRIDILLELSGHTADHRLWSLARKPAPVIVTYLGYPHTTGLPTIDYRIVDAWTDPPGAESFATESLVRLPGPFLCYRPPDAAPEVHPSPSISRGAPLTFGSFNMVQKLNKELAAHWAGALHAAPGSRLVLKGDYRLTAVREMVLGWFAIAGISADRIEMRPMTPTPAEHLEHYADIDIALDTFPYHGTTTTCEALFMGVPALSIVGDRHASRVGFSLLTAMGLPEFACASSEDFARRAAELASDAKRRVELRKTLRSRLASSPLCDAAAQATHFGAALRGMWRRHVERSKAGSA